jgi:esterase/lipase
MSWGGLFAVALAQRVKVTSLTLIAPGIYQRNALNQAVRLASALLRGEQFEFGFSAEDFTYKQQAFVDNDPLRVKAVSPRFCLQTLWLQQLTRTWLQKPNVPAAIHLAPQDRIINSAITTAQSQNLKQFFYPDSAHSIVLDAPSQLAQNIASWLP